MLTSIKNLAPNKLPKKINNACTYDVIILLLILIPTFINESAY